MPAPASETSRVPSAVTATPISSSRPSRTVSTGASAAIGWYAVIGPRVSIRKTVADGGRREPIEKGTAKTAPPAAIPASDGHYSEFADAGPQEKWTGCTPGEAGRPGARALRATLLFLCLLSGGLGRDLNGGGKPS